MKEIEEDIIFEPEDISGSVKKKAYTDDGDVVLDDLSYEEESAQDTIRSLKQALKDQKLKTEEHLIGWQRARADYANLQKTTQEERAQLRTYVVEGVISDLLPVLDSFEMAMDNKAVWESVDANWRKGVEYIFQQLQAVLQQYSVTVIAPVQGAPYSSEQHEILQTESLTQDAIESTIARCIQKGYIVQERVIRPARVAVYAKE